MDTKFSELAKRASKNKYLHRIRFYNDSSINITSVSRYKLEFYNLQPSFPHSNALAGFHKEFFSGRETLRIQVIRNNPMVQGRKPLETRNSRVSAMEC